MTLTPQQKYVVEQIDTDLCVTSGAGCGKTSVLVNRFIHLLERGAATVPEIGAITFTEKAALQMKERIRAACMEKMKDAQPADAASLWENFSREVENARIGTIHGFCARMLREFPVEAGIDPRFVVLDEGEAQVLREHTVTETLLELLEANDPATIELADEFRFTRMAQLIDTLLLEGDRATAIARSLANGDDKRIAERLNLFTDALRQAAIDRIASESIWAEEMTFLTSHRARDSEDKRDLVRRKTVDLVETLRVATSVKKRIETLRELASIDLKGGSVKNWSSKEEMDEIKTNIETIRTACRDCLELCDPDPDDAERDRIESRVAHISRLLAETFLRCREAYESEKRDQSALDFADLLTKARDLLRDRKVARDHYWNTLKFLLVDEFQDTDALQVEIIQSLTSEPPGTFSHRRLFVVGDAQQSIYKFRGADVSVFRDTVRKIERTGETRNLNVTFRARPEIVSFVNDFFGRLIGTKKKEALYEAEYTELVAHRQTPADRPHVEFLVVRPSEEEKTLEALRPKEAELIARRIRGMVDGKEQLVFRNEDGVERLDAVKYGDIAILFRAMTGIGTYEKALREYEIPYYLTSGGGFYGRQEIKDVMSFLKVLENASDEIALAAVLRSPMFGISDNTLYWLKSNGAPLFEAIRNPSDRITGPDRDTLMNAAAIIAELRDAKDRYSLPRLITEIVDRTGYLWVLRTMFLGQQKVSNVRKLIETARDLERSEIITLRTFINYVTDLITGEARESEAVIEEEKSNVVRVTTIHQAKGLEYPVVFVADLAHGPGDAQQPPVLLYRDDAGGAFGLKLTTNTGGLEPTTLYKLISNEEKAKEGAESKRLFYVACTRAKDHLVLSSVIASSKKNTWIAWLDAHYQLSSAASEIAYGKDGYRIAVTTELATPKRRPGKQSIADRHEDKLRTFAPVPEKDGQERSMALKILERVQPVLRSLKRKTLFSVTELDDYGVCPRLYLLKYVHEIPDTFLRDSRAAGEPSKRLPAAERGIVAHRLFQLWTGDGTQDIRHLIDRVLVEHHISDPAVRDEIDRELREMSDTFTAHDLAVRIRTSKDVRSEVRFSLNLDGVVIEGVIDKMFTDSRGTRWVVDFKSDRIGPRETKELVAGYSFQLLMYALAVSRLTDSCVPCASIYFLTPGVEETLPVNAESLAKVRATAADRIASIRNNEFNLKQDGCTVCSYRRVCSVCRETSKQQL